MSMHHGMDLSRFKKVRTDKDSTTLRHPKGHEIRIAHKGVTPKMKESLDKLMFAEGGDVPSVENGEQGPAVDAGGDMDASSPAAAAPDMPGDAPPAADAPQASGDPAAAPPPVAAAPQGDGSSVADGQQVQQSQAGPLPAGNGIAQASQNPASGGPNPDPLPDYLAGKSSTGEYLNKSAVPPPDPVVPPEQAKQAIVASLAPEILKFQKDLGDGNLHPMTYHDWFAKKDTLGKIGSLFGLLISGAGSGLAHKDNAVLAMMNKEIDNDFEAQKLRQTNGQTWYKLAIEHQKQLAESAKMGADTELLHAQAGAIPSQIKRTEAETGLIGAQTSEIPSKIARTGAETELLKGQAGKIPAEIEKIGAENRLMDIEGKIKAAGLAQIYATSAAFQHLTNLANGLPEGAQKQQALNAIGLMYPQYQKEILGQATQLAGMLQQMRTMSGADTTASGKAAIDYNKARALILQGQRKLPGGMDEQDKGIFEKESAKVQENRAMQKSFITSFDELDKMAGAGILDPMIRKAHINVLAAQLARQSAGRYNADEAQSLIDGMFPNPLDSKQARAVKRKKAIEYFQTEEAGTPVLDRFGLKGENKVPNKKTGGLYSNPLVGGGPGGSGGGSTKGTRKGNVEVSFPQDPTQNSNAPSRMSVTGMPFKDGDLGVEKRTQRPTVWKNGKWEYK